MQYLKKLILAFPFFERVADQSCIAGNNGTKYERLIATRGNDYMLVYNYTGRPMQIDLSKIHGKTKRLGGIHHAMQSYLISVSLVQK